MRVTRLRWTAYRLPFRAEFSTSRGVSTYREGLILRLDTDSGVVGLGEAAPVSERGLGTLGEALAILDEVGSGLVGRQLDEVQALMDETGRGDGAMAAVRCAFDLALLDATARAAAISVAELLTGSVSRSVAVNATIGAEAPARAATQAATARESGFLCVKLKVGAASSADEERRRVAAVREALGPEIKLRIDANGAWSVEQAVRAIRELEEYDLEMVEQPVAAGDLPGLARVRAEVDAPIAADEDVTDVEAAERVLEAGAADVLVVKPMIVGGVASGPPYHRDGRRGRRGSGRHHEYRFWDRHGSRPSPGRHPTPRRPRLRPGHRLPPRRRSHHRSPGDPLRPDGAAGRPRSWR